MNDGGTVEWRGDVFSVHAGIDGMLRDGVLVGLSGSKSSGVFDFTDQMGARDIGGEFEANLMSMHPYVAWIRDDIAIWATTGVGWGSMTMTDSIVAERSSNISSLVLATGASKTVHSSPIGSFAIRAEGWTSEVEIRASAPLWSTREGLGARHRTTGSTSKTAGRCSTAASSIRSGTRSIYEPRALAEVPRTAWASEDSGTTKGGTL